MTWIPASLAATVALALAHALSHFLAGLSSAPRRRFLSAAGGLPIAYVFLQLLPGLARGQQMLERSGAAEASAARASQVYVAALLSFLLFYGLERLASTSRGTEGSADDGGIRPSRVFWLHVLTFAITNALTGFLLVQRARAAVRPLVIFTVAMGFWFVVNDRSLHRQYEAAYDRLGRWILVAALAVGWGAGVSMRLVDAVPVVLQAVIAGAVLLNVLKEEVPPERQSSFWAFALGAGAYGALLLAI